ncbi:MAG: AcrR family transcriptional regulator [Candidatus Azotimanducaceae bacterium]|jgi:AcrR family transcriptional regulator
MTDAENPAAIAQDGAKDTLKERYHHGDLRQALLDAACAHLREENADTLSLRALARQIGVSQTAPYRHFDSRNALFAGIATEGFQILERELKQAKASQKDAASGFVELGVAYLRFSVAHKEKYQLFFESSLVEVDEYPALQAASEGSFNLLLELIREGQQSGEFKDGSEEALAALTWSNLHGIASLLQINREAEGFLERPVGRALNYLAADYPLVVRAVLASILVGQHS